MQQITTIIFDFGGVLFDLETDRAIARFADLGLPDADQRLDKYQQRGIFAELETGRITMSEFQVKLEALCGKPLCHSDIQYAWMGYVGKVDPRKLECILQLRRRGYRIVLLSNINPYIMPWAHSTDFSVLGRPIDDYVDAMYLSYEVGALKSDPAFFDHLLRTEGVDPSECVFVDDGPRNIAYGQQIGMATLMPLNNELWVDALLELLNP